MLLAHFQRRGYPLETLQDAMNKIKDKRREDLLLQYTAEEEETVDTSDIVSLITTYTPQCDDLAKLVKKNWGIVQRSSTTKKLSNSRLEVGYRRPKNLRDLLVRAKIKKKSRGQPEKPLSETKNICKTKNCRYCNILDKSGRIKSHVTGREYYSKHNVTCKSSNVIYCITCLKCGKQYVGQTKLRLMDRFGSHFTSINRNDGKNDVCKHFNQKDHNGVKDLKLSIVDFIYAKPETDRAKALRDQIEFHWIQRLRTQLPHGMNTMDKSPGFTNACRRWRNALI